MTPNITETATGPGREVPVVIGVEAGRAIEGGINHRESPALIIPPHLRHRRVLFPSAGRMNFTAIVILPPDRVWLSTRLVHTLVLTLQPRTLKAYTLTGSR